MQIWIGLTGAVGSGKGSAIVALEEIFITLQVVRLSDIIGDSLKTDGIAITRDTLHRHANEHRRIFGSDYWIKEACRQAQPSTQIVVFDGLRNLSEVEFLQRNAHLSCVIGFHANESIRAQRINARKRGIDNLGHLETIAMMQEETTEEGVFGFQLKKCLRAADFVVNAELDLASMQKQIKLIAKTLMKGFRDADFQERLPGSTAEAWSTQDSTQSRTR